jgi:hypothetical protein
MKPPRFVTGAFLRGPVPIKWLSVAGGLPGKAMQVGVYLWFMAGLTDSLQVKVSPSKLAGEWSVSRYALYAALDQLAAADLISAERRKGSAALVTLRVVPVNRSVLEEATPVQYVA